MGYSFTAASSQYLSAPSAVVSGYPFTLACWFKVDATAAHTLVSIGQSTDNDDYVTMFARGTLAGDPLTVVNRADDSQILVGSAGAYTGGSWQHGVAIFQDEDSAAVSLNGAALVEATPGTNVDRSGLWTALTIGARLFDAAQPADGLIAEVAVYDVALNAANIGNLQAKSPLLVRASDLVEHWTLKQGDALTGTVASTALTNNNGATASADHPSIIVPGSGSDRAFFAGARMAGGRMG